MFNMLDKEALLQSATFGALAEPVLYHYRVIAPRVFGSLSRSVPACCGALALQQLLVTPALLWLYFNGVTGARSGFSDTWYMEAHLPQRRHDVATIERYIMETVLPFPLLTSWAVYMPFYIGVYFGPFRGLGLLHYTTLLPWIASVSHIQRTELL
ncbi:hypothetical protein STCU_02199 [Strigomonas culicis]|nr:hypothetical protein STCU_02199 [Strigomonas culicis]|eukprot:EPY33476.1 hypothetical protein STCU_02199 [Strigomonas culicis]